MELDELKQSWDSFDRKLDASIRLNTRLLRDGVLGKVKSALTRLIALLSLDVVFSLAAAVWIGGFAWDHRGEPRFLVPAAMLHAAALLLLIASARQIVSLATIDYGAPILEIQRRLGSLHVERLRAMKWTFLLAPLSGTLLIIVGAESLLGVDLWRYVPAWLWGNIAFGVGVIVVGEWIARRFAERLKQSRLMGAIAREVAGHNLRAATEHLRSLEEYAE